MKNQYGIFVALMLLAQQAQSEMLIQSEPQESALAIKTQDQLNEILESDAQMVIFVGTPWCGHCRRAKPQLIESSKDPLLADVRFALIDATEAKDWQFMQELRLRGYPALYFKWGNHSTIQYGGARVSVESIIATLKELPNMELGVATQEPTFMAWLLSWFIGNQSVKNNDEL